MSVITFKDQVTEGLDKLIDYWADKPNVVNLLKSFLENIQLVEDVYQDLNTNRSITTAVGVQLDNIGTIVGEARQGLEDDPYRRAINLRIGINNSDGTEPVVIPLIKQITNADSVTMTEEFPAGARCVVVGSDLELDNNAIADINTLFAAGVLLTITGSVTGADFTPVDVDALGDNDYTNPDTSIVDYKYYEATPPGKWFQDYEELTTADIQLDTAKIGTKYSVFVNRNSVDFTSPDVDTNNAATELATLINALPDISASAITDTITVTGARFTLYAISQNTTMTPAYLSDSGGVMVDVLVQGDTVTNTNSNLGTDDGLTPIVVLTINSIGSLSLPFNAELIGFSDISAFGTMSDPDLKGDVVDYLQISYNNAAPSDSSIQIKILGTNLSHTADYISKMVVEGVGTFDTFISFNDSPTEQVWIFEANPNTLGIGDWADTLTRTVTVFF
ncbi:MAG: DUF2612 domain-containing protein [Gammaproteobacteria bacterium]|nr:DUF2612 domain-containing protein [Gammaproteobacteria bacterium]